MKNSNFSPSQLAKLNKSNSSGINVISFDSDMGIKELEYNSELTFEENMLLSSLMPTSGTEMHNGVRIRGMQIALIDYLYGVKAFDKSENGKAKAAIAESALLKMNPLLKNKI